MSIRSQIISLFVIAVIGNTIAVAQQPKPGAKTNSRKPKSRITAKARSGAKPRPVALTPVREAAAMTFAESHHPELAKLINTLKKRRKRQYRRAVGQLFQTSKRLARIQERSPDRYELSLTAWKLDSRIRLLVARMTMTENSALEEKLQGLVRDRLDVRVRQLKQDRKRATERAQKLEVLIERIEGDREAALKRQLLRVKRIAVRGKKGKSKKNRKKQTTKKKTGKQ